MKFVLFPTDEEKIIFEEFGSQWRWFYNFAVNVYNKFKIDRHLLREELKKYKYETKENEDNIEIFMDKILYDEKQTDYYIPPFFTKVHNRIIRGAIAKLQANLESMTSNGNGNRKLKYRSKKKDNNLLSFDDFNFPSMLKEIKSYYGYRTKKKERKSISLANIVNEAGEHGCIFTYEQETKRYYLHYPVPTDYYPKDDRRYNENQVKSESLGGYISVDLGVRKFATGIDSKNNQVFVKTNTKLTQLLIKESKEKRKEAKQIIWQKIKNMIDDLHWKVIKYLVSNYKVIIIGDIRTQNILKSKKIGKMVKRILTQFSFCKFKERLKYKCKSYNRSHIIINEAYTTITCTNCGILNDIGKSETYKCSSCHYTNDRDITGALNILLKVIAEVLKDTKQT